MITLYRFHWSHYVEKVRWALDFKGVEWRAVDVDPFTKREMQHLPCRATLDSGKQLHTVPAIQDDATGAVVSESTTIIEYLERTYPSPALYPADASERAEVTRWLLWLDSTLGLGARRLAYTQMAAEHPGFLSELFLPHMAGAGAGHTLKGKLGGAIIAGVLTRRFRFLHNRADGVYEQIEQCLLFAAERLSTRRYLVGDRFTAADLTLAALMRPTLLVAYFRKHPRLQALYEWRERQVRDQRREPRVSYETALHEVRQRRGWELTVPREIIGSEPAALTEVPALSAARNDQQSVGRWPVLTGAFWCLRLRWTSGMARAPYP